MRLSLLFLLMFAVFGAGAEIPLVLRDAGIHSSNVFHLPSKTQGLWLYFPEANPERSSVFVQAERLEESRFRLDFTNAFPGPFTIKPRLVAGRLLIDHRFSEIQPILIEPWRVPEPTNGLTDIVVSAVKDASAKYFFDLSSATQHVGFEVVANRLGSKLDPVLRITDGSGIEIARVDDTPTADRDAVVSFVSPHPGRYMIQVSDIANGSGEDYFFVLRSDLGDTLRAVWDYDIGVLTRFSAIEDRAKDAPIAEKYSGHSLRAPACLVGTFETKGVKHNLQLEAEQNQRLKFSTHTRQFGSPCDAAIALYTSEGKLLSESIGVGTEGASITNKFDKAGTYRIEIREISRLAGQDLNYWLKIEEIKPGVVLTIEVERVDFSKEGEAKIKVACKRYDYDGAVKLDLEGLPGGVSVSDAVIPKGKDEAELKLKREKEVEAFQVRINGLIEGKETEGSTFPVSTMPALRKLYPLQMFPCAAMDGWIAVNPPAP